jgi:alkanesulfonate monooxygenase
MTHPAITTPERIAEFAWFCDLCGGDTEFLGVVDQTRRSNFEHCKNILLTAEQQGFSNILLPSSYVVGQDPITFAAAVSQLAKRINLLVAIRTGELHPPMLARSLATLDHLLEGRMTVNIINSDLPGWKEDPQLRYDRCAETIQVLKSAWTEDRIEVHGQVYDFDMMAAPSKSYQQNGGPLLYFGGLSDGAKEVCAQYCDVYLLWPDTEENLAFHINDMSKRAAKYGRTLDFGLRVHVIVRETETEALAYTQRLLSKLDDTEGQKLKSRTQDVKSYGVAMQERLREVSDEQGFAEPLLWTGINRARSGCGAAVVGTPSQHVEKFNRYLDMGFRAFVLSGYPLIEECQQFGQLVLPHLPNVTLSQYHHRTPSSTPVTPLTTGVILAGQ